MKKIIAAIVLIGSSAFALEPVNVIEVTQTGNLMPNLAGASGPAIETEIKFKALSGGCTRAEDFSINVNEKNGQSEIAIIRNRPDMCEAVARPIELTLTTDKIDASHYGKNQIMVKNPVLVKTQFVQ